MNNLTITKKCCREDSLFIQAVLLCCCTVQCPGPHTALKQRCNAAILCQNKYVLILNIIIYICLAGNIFSQEHFSVIIQKWHKRKKKHFFACVGVWTVLFGHTTNMYRDKPFHWEYTIKSRKAYRSGCFIQEVADKSIHQLRLDILTHGHIRTRTCDSTACVIINKFKKTTELQLQNMAAYVYWHVYYV